MTINPHAQENGHIINNAPPQSDEYNGLNGPNDDPEAIGYDILDQPIGTKRKVRIVTIGGGASGIVMAWEVKRYLENVDFVAYEKSPELGGTWLDNRYPGCACDVPSHSYQFSFHPNTKWTHFYSGSEEICAYMNDVVDTYGLRGMFRTSCEVLDARWDDETSEWVVKVKGPEGEFEDRCDFLVNGSGILNNWQWPKIEGLHEFKGHLVHTARWDPTYDYKGKKLASIGVGSSAVQTIPQLVPLVEHLTAFIRSGAWITAAGAGSEHAGPGGSNKAYTEEEKRKWAEDPEAHLKYCKMVEESLNSRYGLFLKDSDLQKLVVKMGTESMTSKLAPKPELAKTLIPKFGLGCRRITPGNGFLESLCEDNVTVETTGIERVTPTGIMTKDGKHVEVDAIVCATGFDVSLLPRFPFIGRNGADLKKRWTEGPVEGYMSLMVADYPNYFTFLGPSAPVAHGSLTHVIEKCAHWMIKSISKMQGEGIKSIAPKADIIRKFNIHRNALMPTTTWSSSCSSWYKNGKADGPVIAIHPGSKLHFFDMIRNPRFEDMEIEYMTDNPFSYLGDGFSRIELDADADKSWYLTKPFDVDMPW